MRKAKWIAAFLAASPIGGIDLIEPTPLVAEQLTGIHTPEYIDPDTEPQDHFWREMVTLHPTFNSIVRRAEWTNRMSRD